MKVDRYVEPAEFDRWKQIAENMGFLYVASGPLVRSSYKVGVSYFRHTPWSFNFSPRRVNTLSRMYSAGRGPRRGLRTLRLSMRTQMRSYLHDHLLEERIRAYNTVVPPHRSKSKTMGLCGPFLNRIRVAVGSRRPYLSCGSVLLSGVNSSHSYNPK